MSVERALGRHFATACVIALGFLAFAALMQKGNDAPAVAEPQAPPSDLFQRRLAEIEGSYRRPDESASGLRLDFEWRAGGFGSIAIVDLTFKNENTIAVKDPVVECTFYGASGTKISTKTQTIYRSFGPKKSGTAKGISLGFINQQSATGACRVMSVTRI